MSRTFGHVLFILDNSQELKRESPLVQLKSVGHQRVESLIGSFYGSNEKSRIRAKFLMHGRGAAF
jgi:hypothetical protein